MPPKQMSTSRSVLQLWVGAGLGRFRQGFSPGLCLLESQHPSGFYCQRRQEHLAPGKAAEGEEGRKASRMKISKWGGMANSQQIESKVTGSTQPPSWASLGTCTWILYGRNRAFHILETFLDFPEGRSLPGSHALAHCPVTGSVRSSCY